MKLLVRQQLIVFTYFHADSNYFEIVFAVLIALSKILNDEFLDNLVAPHQLLAYLSSVER